MGHHQLRTDQTCLNCGNRVEERFCSHCGQENVETRQSFLALLQHFLEDITHYEGKFWITLRYLFFSPGYLTQEFLAGKRNRYVAPVRLYIFISFITFFLPHVLPHLDEEEHSYTAQQLKELDSLYLDGNEHLEYYSELGLIYVSGYRTMHSLDSARNAVLGTPEEMSYLEYQYHKKAIQLKRYNPHDLLNLLLETLSKNFPKSLFIYLPVFAFIVGWFHRRKFVYYDHAVFTLHFFSFLLLSFSCYLLLLNGINWFDYYTGNNWAEFYLTWFSLMMVLWYTVYFHRAHYKLYHDKPITAVLKGVLIFLITLTVFVFLFIILLFYSLISLH